MKLSQLLVREDFYRLLLKTICQNENFLFVCKEVSTFQNLSLQKKNTLISPISIGKIIDRINNLINTKKHIFINIELNNHIIINFDISNNWTE